MVYQNLFNEHFSTIGQQTAQHIPQTTKHFTDYIDIDQQSSFAFFPIGPTAVVETVNKLHDKNT